MSLSTWLSDGLRMGVSSEETPGRSDNRLDRPGLYQEFQGAHGSRPTGVADVGQSSPTPSSRSGSAYGVTMVCGHLRKGLDVLAGCSKGLNEYDHDRIAASLDHGGHEPAVDLARGKQVQLQRFASVLLVVFPPRLRPTTVAAGVVHHDVDTTEPVQYLGRHPRRPVEGSDVGLDEHLRRCDGAAPER